MPDMNPFEHQFHIPTQRVEPDIAPYAETDEPQGVLAKILAVIGILIAIFISLLIFGFILVGLVWATQLLFSLASSMWT